LYDLEDQMKRAFIAAAAVAIISASTVQAGPLGWAFKKAAPVAVGIGVGILLSKSASASEDTLFDKLDVLSDSVDAANDEGANGRSLAEVAKDLFVSDMAKEVRRACDAEPKSHKEERISSLLQDLNSFEANVGLAFEACCVTRVAIEHGVLAAPGISFLNALPAGNTRATKIISRL
jgi:hypothetical protein